MQITLRQASRVWAKIGLMSFGGPAGQIALMHQELVEKRRWVSEERFLNALNFCMLLPGPEAQQLSIYLGWLMHKTKGGLIAGLLFILPGCLCIALLSIIYVSFGNTPVLGAVFSGLKAAVLAIVIQAIFKLAKKTLKNKLMIGVAIASFFSLYFLHIAFPIIIAASAVLGFIAHKWLPHLIAKPSLEPATNNAKPDAVDYVIDQQAYEHTLPSWRKSIKTLLIWLLIWLLPIAAVLLAFGADSVLGKQAVFFSHTAIFSFGGAYAVLAYVAQRVVNDYQWITPREMVDGLALAETTPGPLIMVLQFVAFLAAYQHQTGLSPLIAGLLASVITLWATFAPCFLWIFLGAPYIEKLRRHAPLQAALKTITAAIVGVIANLSLWFAFHTLFSVNHKIHWHQFTFEMPQLQSIQWPMLCMTAIALIASVRYKISSAKIMLMCTIIALAAHSLKASNAY
jgi:chromate transporter